MRKQGRIGGVMWLVLVTLFGAMAASDVRAQLPFRWKFKAGEKLRYNVVDEMTLTSRGAPLEETTAPLRQEMDVTWTVASVKDGGEAVIEQKFDRIQLTMTGPRGEKIEYDSAGDEDTPSLAALVAPIYDALMKGEIKFTMTARGEIKDVQVAEEVLEALKGSPGAAMLGDAATPDGLQRMLVQWNLVLPEEIPKLEEEWRSRVKQKTPVGEEQIVESTYRYKGLKEIDGRSYAEFQPGLEITFTGAAGATTKVKELDSNGEILFDVEAGRLQSAVLKRDLTTDVTAAGQTAEQTVVQTVTVKLIPVE